LKTFISPVNGLQVSFRDDIQHCAPFCQSLEINPNPNPNITCGQLQNQGVESWPAVFTVELGTDTGNVDFAFNAFTAPDKFIVEWDGVEVINTGYRGSSSQGALDARLAYNGAASEPIAGVGAGTASFNKTTALPSTATVTVWAPGAPGSTIWNFQLDCPEPVEEDEV